MNDITRLLNKHMQMEFPKFSENDELAEWIEDLAEIEGHYVGLITTDKIKNKDLDELTKIGSKLTRIRVTDNDDIEVFNYCKKYFQILNELALAAVKTKKD